MSQPTCLSSNFSINALFSQALPCFFPTFKPLTILTLCVPKFGGGGEQGVKGEEGEEWEEREGCLDVLKIKQGRGE